LRVRHVGDKCLQTIKSTDRGTGLFSSDPSGNRRSRVINPDLSRVKGTALGRILIDEVAQTI